MSSSIRIPILLIGLLWSAFLFAIPPSANAGVILQAPTYVGLNSGLVGSWSFDGKDMAGITAYDRSGAGNHGTTTGTSRVAGNVGQALQFDGVGDYVEVPSTMIGSLSDKIVSVSAWIKPNLFTSFKTVFDGTTNAADTGRQLSLFIDTPSTGYAAAAGISGNGVNFSPSWTTNEWQHLVFISDGTNIFTYRNGVQNSSTGGAIGSAFSAAPWRIGGNPSGGGTKWDGLIDDIRIYNRALSADEIRRLYKIGGTLTTKAPTNHGLVGYWRFDEGAGTIAGDGSGNGNHGTTTNMANPPTATSGWTNGRVGKALSFDGADDGVAIPDSPTLNPSVITVSAWVKPRVLPQNQYATIVNKRFDESLSPYNNWILDAGTAGGESHFCITNSAGGGPEFGQWCLSGSPLTTNWMHIAGTYDGSTQILYVNGSQAAQQSISLSLATSILPVRIGQPVTGGGGQSFNGLIDDVRVYNRALSADEIQNLYESSKQVFVNASQRNQLTNGLVGYWTFDGQDMAGATAYDRSGQGNNGFLFTNGDGTPGGAGRAAGKIGQALSFNGVDDYAVVPGDPAVLNPSRVTVSAWIKRTGPLPDPDGGGVAGKWGGNGYLIFLAPPNGDIQFPLNDQPHLSSGVSAALNTWYHVVGTFDGSIARLYIDGVEKASQSDSLTSNAGPFEIGRYATVATSGFPGLIDEVRVYNRALSADEVKRLYNMGR